MIVLYTMMLCSYMFTRMEGTHLSTIINKHELLVLNVYNDVGSTIAVDIADFGSNGSEVLAVTK